MKTEIVYLNHRIEIDLPDPTEDNTIHVCICRLEGTYNTDLYNDFLCQFQFSGKVHANYWLVEAISCAIDSLNFWAIKYLDEPEEALYELDNEADDIFSPINIDILPTAKSRGIPKTHDMSFELD